MGTKLKWQSVCKDLSSIPSRDFFFQVQISAGVVVQA
jgi:hypothetical protein